MYIFRWLAAFAALSMFTFTAMPAFALSCARQPDLNYLQYQNDQILSGFRIKKVTNYSGCSRRPTVTFLETETESTLKQTAGLQGISLRDGIIVLTSYCATSSDSCFKENRLEFETSGKTIDQLKTEWLIKEENAYRSYLRWRWTMFYFLILITGLATLCPLVLFSVQKNKSFRKCIRHSLKFQLPAFATVFVLFMAYRVIHSDDLRISTSTICARILLAVVAIEFSYLLIFHFLSAVKRD